MLRLEFFITDFHAQEGASKLLKEQSKEIRDIS